MRSARRLSAAPATCSAPRVRRALEGVTGAALIGLGLWAIVDVVSG